jgi:Flp pilus assembly protein CpaB
VKSLPFILAGLLLGVALSGALAFSAGSRRVADARRGWQLVPIVVAAVDVKAGRTIRQPLDGAAR